MVEIAANGETEPLSEDKEQIPVCRVSVCKDDACDSFEVDKDLEDSLITSEEKGHSSEIKVGIENGDTTVSCLDTKEAADINSTVIKTELQPNSLENDNSKSAIDEEGYKIRILNIESELNNYKNKYEILFSSSSSIDDALHEAQQQLKDVNIKLEQKDIALSEMELRLQDNSIRMQEEVSAAEKCNNDANDYEQLRSQLAKITSEKETLLIDNERLKLSVEKFQNTVHDSQDKMTREEQRHNLETDLESRDVIELERALNEANEKISELLKVKEKYAEVDLEKTNIGNNLSELEEEMDVLSFQTRTATACSMIPLAILVLALMVAYLPYLSNLFGTVD